MPLPTGTVTFLFTDIEGSTKLWEQYPDPMRATLAYHDALLHQTIEDHNGYVFKTVGDAFCAAFATAMEGLAAALAAQQALHTETWSQEIGTLRVRMALHTGTAEERNGDYFGPPVNRVARLLAIGHGKQVLLSEETMLLVRDRLPDKCGLRDMHPHRLKDLQRPEHVWQLLHPALTADFPPLKSLSPTMTNLPIQPTSFIGREQELEEVKTLLSSTRLLTLTGTGGCGKTRLALQVAADVMEPYGDGVWLVELASLSEANLVPQTVATALGLREEPGHSLTETLTAYLKSKSLLLILDNCEHLVEACATLVNMLLRSCANLKILATSREPLNVAGEHLWRVPSLLPPDPNLLPTDEKDFPSILAEYDAVRLFMERATVQRKDFRLQAQNARAIAQVCHRLDGIPLALELAAARVRALTAEQIADRLDDRFRLLTGGSRTVLPRQQTLQALLDWSYNLLTEAERSLLHRLSVFAGGWTLVAAEAVCAGKGIEDGDVLDLQASLVDKSLVVFEEREGEPGGRYHLLETIRHYAQERLKESEDEAQWQRQHRDFLLAWAEEAEPYLQGEEQVVWLNRLETEHNNLRGALATCQAMGAAGAEAGLRLCAALSRFWWTRGYLSEGRAWMTAVLSQAGSQERTRWRGKALTAAGGLALIQDDYASAQTCFEESLAIFRELGNREGIAASLGNLALVANSQGDYASARAFQEQSLIIARELGDQWSIAASLGSLGNTTYSQGDYASAQVCLEESLAIYQELGDRRSVAIVLNTLGNMAHAQRDFSSARTFYQESLANRREIGDRGGIASALCDLGLVTYHQGDFSSARAFYEQSVAIEREIGGRLGIANALLGFAALAMAQAHLERAVRLGSAADALREQIGAPLTPSQREEYDQAVAVARAMLGEEAFTATWTEGRKMTIEQAIEYALADRRML